MTTNSAELKRKLKSEELVKRLRDSREVYAGLMCCTEAADHIEELERKLELETIERRTFQHGLRLKEKRIEELEGRMPCSPEEAISAWNRRAAAQGDQSGSAEQVSERETELVALKDLIVDVLHNHGWDGRLLDCNYAEAADDIIEAIDHCAALSAPERKVTYAPMEDALRDALTSGLGIVRIDPAAIYQQGEQTAAGWQPIETAPKDGANVLLINRKGHIAAGLWLDGILGTGWFLRGGNQPNVFFNEPHGPTHWMPLPAAPSTAQPSLVCKQCGADRMQEGCKGDMLICAIRGAAQKDG